MTTSWKRRIDLTSMMVGLRRLLFLTALLSMGAISTSCFDFGYNWSRPSGGQSPPALIAFATFMWGADSMGTVLAAWLAGRKRIWHTWSGCIRVVLYLAAYTYGRLLHSATQDWLRSHDDRGVSFPWPGANWDDYARPAIDLLSVLMLVWLLVPMFAICRGFLADGALNSRRKPISIAFLFGWTAVAAVILLWIRFLTWEGVAPKTAFSSASATALLVQNLTQKLPSKAVIAVAVMLMVLAWPRKWWLPIVAFIVALLLDSFGHGAIFWTVEYFTGHEAGSNVLTGAAMRRWSYFAGRNFIVWIAFGAAHLTGISFHRASV
jgi:small-conductance mechanosensitive channel